MADEDEKKIDLHNLTQRELLIVVARDLKQLKRDFEDLQEEHHKMALKVNELETRSKLWGAIAGFVTAIIATIGERFLNR